MKNSKNSNNNKIFEFKNKKYNLKVGLDEKSKLLKLIMINIDTKEEININVSGVIPQGATPNYILVNDKIGEELIKKLIDCELLSDRTGIYAKVNLDNIYKYDPKGVKEFLDCHTHKIEYEDKGKTQDEVKKDIRKYTEKMLQNKKIKEYLDDYIWRNDPKKYIFMYSLLNKKNPQDSIIAYCDENAENILLITPYQKDFEDKFEIVPDWQFNYYGGMMNFLDAECEIIDVGEESHYSIWQEVYDRLIEPRDERYKKGVEKYMKYCKKNKITKERIMKSFNLEDFTEDIMEFYKPKYKER